MVEDLFIYFAVTQTNEKKIKCMVYRVLLNVDTYIKYLIF